MLKRQLAVTLLAGGMILGFSPAGTAAAMNFEHVMNIGSEGSGEGQFKYVEDFALAKDGNLLATDASHAYVQVFNKTTGAFVARFGGKGDEDANLEKPEGISVAPDGRIFVADYTTGYVKIYDSGYKWLKTFSDFGEAPGQNIKSEFTDIHDGKYYMPEAGNHRVSVWDLEGNFLFLFGGQGTEPGKMNNPEAAKFNSKGMLYVSDLKNDRMQVFTGEGAFVKTWGKTGAGPGEFKAPAGVAIDKDDNVYVTEIGNDRVQVFDADGNFITMWGRKGAADGEFGNLHGIMVDKATGLVYVADTANNRVQVFKPVQ
jgi:DNA-binding beta-propeller fold protein YncE